MKNYEWITFDCYGTLIDWENGISSAFEKAAKTSWAVFDRKRVLALYAKYEAEEEVVYRTYREILKRVSRRICFDQGYNAPVEDFLMESLVRWRPFPDTNAALQRLSRKCKLGILSNVDNDLLDQTRKHLAAAFQLIVTAQDVASYKPSLKHFQEARRKIGNRPWIHVAQSYFHDIIPCGQLGIDAAWINRNHEEPKGKKVPVVFEGPDLESFANWFEEN